MLWKCPLPTVWRRILLALAACAVVIVGHAPVLRLLARPLVADEPGAEMDCLCLAGGAYGFEGDNYFDMAAQWRIEQPAGRYAVLEPWPCRVVEIGVLPTFESTCRRELARRGVPNTAVFRLPGCAWDDWDKARVLAAWLQDHPGASMGLLVGRFQGGRTRYVLRTVLGRAEADRVRILAVPDADCTEANWWRSRGGAKTFAFAWLKLGFAWCEGEDRFVPRPASAAEYERALQEHFGKAP